MCINKRHIYIDMLIISVSVPICPVGVRYSKQSWPYLLLFITAEVGSVWSFKSFGGLESTDSPIYGKVGGYMNVNNHMLSNAKICLYHQGVFPQKWQVHKQFPKLDLRWSKCKRWFLQNSNKSSPPLVKKVSTTHELGSVSMFISCIT